MGLRFCATPSLQAGCPKEHPAAVEQGRQLRGWRGALAVGRALPCVPLRLGVDVCVPLDLETSYQMTCTDLRFRLAG